MPYLRDHSRVTWFGDAYTASEIWQVGVRLDGTTVPTEAQMDALNTAFSTFWDTVAAGSPTTHRFLGSKWAPQDVNGLYGLGEAVERFLAVPNAGQLGGGYPQICSVYSLRTARPRGLASNGRIYMPSATTVDPVDGRQTENSAIQKSTAGALFVSDVNAVGLGQVAVFSTVGAGLIEPVTGVRVGRVMDTQRRRRNALDEAYPAEALLPS